MFKTTIQDLSLEMITCNARVVIFGTGHLGIVCLNALRAYGIEPVAFCDSNKDLSGTKIDNVIIKEPRKAAQEHKDDIFLLAAFQSVIRKQMLDTLISTDNRLIIHAYTPQSLFLWFYRDYVKRPINYEEYEITVERCFTETDTIFNVDTTQVHINQYCTIKCKNCSNLIPYLPVRKHEDADLLIKTVEGFCEVIDSVRVLTLVGGEGLMHPDIIKIIHGIAQCSNAMAITIVTNGTWAPEDIIFKELSRAGVALRISGYGEISDKINYLINKCKEYNVVCFREMRSSTWIEYGTIEQQKNGFGRSIKENKIVYKKCVFFSREHSRLCNSILARGRWYICDRFLILTNLLGVEYETTLNENDYLSLLLRKDEPDKRRERFIEYLNRDYLPVCDHCKYPQKIVPSGEQLKD